MNESTLIVFTGDKGGVGKSTLAVLMTEWLLSKGKQVQLVDADPNQTSKIWTEKCEALGYRVSTSDAPVTVVDKVANKKKTAAVARAYLEFLYTPQGQEIAAKHYYRPRLPAVAQKHARQFPQVQLFTIQEFGGWAKAQQTHFADGGVFDRIYEGR